MLSDKCSKCSLSLGPDQIFQFQYSGPISSIVKSDFILEELDPRYPVPGFVSRFTQGGAKGHGHDCRYMLLG